MPFYKLLPAAALLLCVLPARAFQVVFDGEDPALKITAGTGWVLDKTGSFQGNYRFSAIQGTGTSLATWTLDGLPSGNYTVEFYIDNGDYAQVTPYAIEHDGGLTNVNGNQNFAGAGWKSLGTYQFTHAGRITQSDAWSGAGTKVIADALRITYQGGTPSVPTLNVVPPEITFVVDDLGALNPNNSSTYTYQLYHNVPLGTYAVLPGLTYSNACLQAAAALDVETILHQPLQYIGQPDSNPGDPTRVYISMTDPQIVSVVQNNMTPMLPYIVGVNNHQGSRFSQFAHGMDVLLGAIKAENLFYFDSRTITDSHAYNAAKAAGMLTGERDLFIDGSSVQNTKDLILSVAERARYAPNLNFTTIAHQRVNSVPGIIGVQPDLVTMGVGQRRLSRQMSYIVETDFQPPGASVDYVGIWQTAANDVICQELYDGDSRTFIGVGPGSATFRPNLPQDGMYRVFVGFANDPNNLSAVAVNIAAQNGPHQFALDQANDGGRWHYVGTYPFSAGTAGAVQLNNSPGASLTRPLRADAVKWNYDGPITTSVGEWQKY